MSDTPHDVVIADTRRWLNRAVIGLNLCPFAKAVEVKQQIRYVVCDATEPDAIVQALMAELQYLAEADPERLDTTLLVLPQALPDFEDFNDFLDVADAVLEELELDGILQVADFHPDYRFADAPADDVSNCTNRAPYPTLHLLRESSIERAVASFPDAAEIYETNIDTLRKLGHEGWRKLLLD